MKTPIISLLLITILFATIATAVETDVSIDHEIKIEFGGDDLLCEGESSGGNNCFVFQVTNDDYTIARYEVYVPGGNLADNALSIKGYYPNPDEKIKLDIDDKIDKILGDLDDDDVDYDNDDWDLGDTNKIISTFTPDYSDTELEFICENADLSTGGGDGLLGNLSFCYGALERTLDTEKVCRDNAELMGEYRAKFESTKEDYDDCAGEITTLKNDNRNLNAQVIDLRSESESSSNQYDTCSTSLRETKLDLTKAQNESGQRIMYGIAGLAIGLFIMNMMKKNKEQHSGYSSEEREMDWD